MEETMKCETCRYFSMDVTGPGAGRFGSCSRWHQGYGVRADEIAENEVLVESDEGWAMMMGPKFGCVLHEPLPSSPVE